MRKRVINGVLIDALCRAGAKVEVSLEEEALRDVWFPATVLDDLGNNQFLVEYSCSGNNGQSELHRVNMDRLHIRPSVTRTKYILNLSEKVDAFYDFGWWSGVITKELGNGRYEVYFKHMNKVKEFSFVDLRLQYEWKDDMWNSNYTTREVPVSMKRSKPTNTGGNDKPLNPSKKLKAGIASHDPDLSDKGPSEEVNNQFVAQTVDKTKRLLRGKKTSATQDKGVDFSKITSARKKGLRCKALKELFSKSPKNVGEPALQSSVPLASKTTENQDEKIGGEGLTKLKWGKTCRRQPTSRNASPAWKKSATLQQEKSNTPVIGKRGRTRMVSLDTESSPQDLQGSSRRLENGNSDIVEKSLDLVSENQPLSSLFVASAGKKPPDIPPSMTNRNDQKQSFVKRSSFWATIESMEAFRLFPQNPHFLPLNNLNESARERHAIHKMVEFSCLYEDMCHLKLDHPRPKIEDKLDTLMELETHGFGVDLLKKRMVEILYWKDKREALETGSKEPADNLEIERVKVQERDRDIVLLESQINELRDKLERLVKENEESKLKIVGWEEKVGENEEAKRECDRKLCELATASF